MTRPQSLDRLQTKARMQRLARQQAKYSQVTNELPNDLTHQLHIDHLQLSDSQQSASSPQTSESEKILRPSKDSRQTKDVTHLRITNLNQTAISQTQHLDGLASSKSSDCEPKVIHLKDMANTSPSNIEQLPPQLKNIARPNIARPKSSNRQESQYLLKIVDRPPNPARQRSTSLQHKSKVDDGENLNAPQKVAHHRKVTRSKSADHQATIARRQSKRDQNAKKGNQTLGLPYSITHRQIHMSESLARQEVIYEDDDMLRSQKYTGLATDTYKPIKSRQQKIASHHSNNFNLAEQQAFGIQETMARQPILLLEPVAMSKKDLDRQRKVARQEPVAFQIVKPQIFRKT